MPDLILLFTMAFSCVRIHRKLLFASILLTAVFQSIYAQDVQVNLFIGSSPINAAVFIDGEPQAQATPVLLRGISTGSHEIKIISENYQPYIDIIELTDKNSSFFADLNSKVIPSSFVSEENIILRADEDKILGNNLLMPESGYRISREGRDVIITPIYQKEKLLTAISTLLPISFGFTAAAFGIDWYESSRIRWPQPLYLTALESTTLLLGATEIALLIDRSDYLKHYEIAEFQPGSTEADAELIFQQAGDALAGGSLEEALSLYSEIISFHKDSKFYAESIYRSAKIHIITGDTPLAVAELNMIIMRYQTPEVYDRACQAIALLYYNLDEPGKSKEYAEKMVFIDPLFSGTEEEIQASGIETVIESWARNPAERLE